MRLVFLKRRNCLKTLGYMFFCCFIFGGLHITNKLKNIRDDPAESPIYDASNQHRQNHNQKQTQQHLKHVKNVEVVDVDVDEFPAQDKPLLPAIDNEEQQQQQQKQPVAQKQKHQQQQKPIKACILTLLQEKDLEQFLRTLKMLEANFNSKYNYPYVVLNQVELSDEFKRTVRAHTHATVEFGVIEAEHWSTPEWIDKAKLDRSLRHIGFKLAYRHMCRFMSGFFFRHALTLKYDYYLRIDRDSEFPCALRYDPFRLLDTEHISYGFAMASYEGMFTIPTLWRTIRAWMDESQRRPAVNNTLAFVSSTQGTTLDTSSPCIFYDNFEVASFAMYRSKQYLSYFDYLDRSGGFYYERWGDAPVHTYYIVNMLNKSEVRFMHDLPYSHQGNSIYPNIGANCQQTRLDFCSAKWKKV